jgi:hypothetical protein
VVEERMSGSENRWSFEGEAKSELVDVGKDQASARTGAWPFETPLVEFAQDKQYEQTCGTIACQYGSVK